MTQRVCYLARHARATRLAWARLVAGRLDQTLTPPSADNGAGFLSVTDAAAWIKEQLSTRPGPLDSIYLDAEAGACGWITTPSREARFVGAIARSGPSSEENGPGGPMPPLSEYAGSEQDASVESLGEAESGESGRSGLRALLKPRSKPVETELSKRLGVVAVSDVLARLLLDELDLLGVEVGSVGTVWHAMAAAWDPAGAVARRAGEGDTRRESIEVESHPVSAQLLVEPEGRLIWSWSRAGQLLAGGSMRLTVERGVEGGNRVRIGPEDAGRVVTEWLSWSAQLGVAPARVVLVLPSVAAPDEAGPGWLAGAIAKAWPGASVDAAVDEDPIGATLHRLSGSGDDAPIALAGLTRLSGRPGRLERRMHLWGALALAVLALVVGVAAWQVRSAAGEATKNAEDTRQEWTDLVRSVYSKALDAKDPPLTVLRNEIAKREKASELSAALSAGPILKELEALSYVLSLPEFELVEISLANGIAAQVSVTVVAPNLAEGARLGRALEAVLGSSATAWEVTYPTGAADDEKMRVVYEAKWAKPSTLAEKAP